MVKIRLKRVGKKKAPFYHIVVADSRSFRDVKVIDQLGTYDPLTKESTINIDLEKVNSWILKGARLTDRAKKIVEIAKSAK